jgi:hypothetical protein
MDLAMNGTPVLVTAGEAGFGRSIGRLGDRTAWLAWEDSNSDIRARAM